jgi:hypothetical protein
MITLGSQLIQLFEKIPTSHMLDGLKAVNLRTIKEVNWTNISLDQVDK